MEEFKPTSSMSLDNQGQLAKEATNTIMVSQYEKYHYNKVDRNLLEIFEEIKRENIQAAQSSSAKIPQDIGLLLSSIPKQEP